MPQLYAHTIGGASGPEIELLVAAAGVLVVGLLLRPWRRDSGQTGIVLMIAAVALLALAFFVPSEAPSRSSNAIVSFVRPRDGAEVRAGEVPIKVEVRNAPLATSRSSSGGHLHLYVDGKLEQMPYSTTTRVMLEPGEHELTVEYVDFEHLSFDPPVRTSIEVTATPAR